MSALIEARTISGSSGANQVRTATGLPVVGIGVRRGQSVATPTPLVIVDVDRLNCNLREFATSIADRRVAFRPHVTSHRCLSIALRQIQLGAVGFTASSPREAEILWDAGFRDVVITFPVAGATNWQRIARLAGDGQIAVHVDSEAGARGLSEAARAAGTTIGVQIEIDAGGGLSGVDATDIDAVAGLAEVVTGTEGLDYQGIAAARGTARHTWVGNESPMGEQGLTMAAVVDALRARALPPNVVAAGSTQTARTLAECPAITEVRAGAYPFLYGDSAAGTVDTDRIALTVESTVVSVTTDGRVTLDAGSTTFGASRPGVGGAFAISTDGRVSVERLDADHGLGRLAKGASAKVGERLRLIPASAVAAIGEAGALIAVRDDEVREIWPTTSRVPPT